jgi:hypothetical protein
MRSDSEISSDVSAGIGPADHGYRLMSCGLADLLEKGAASILTE